MKSKLIYKHPGWSARSGGVAAAAVACGYWVSQIIATYFVSGAETRISSWTIAAICFGAFAALFVLHLQRPWSRTAAIFGLCSFAAFVTLVWYDTNAVFINLAVPVWLVMLISTLFGVAGLAMDAKQCWNLKRTDRDFEI